ncbi:uncharacterized protein LOC116200058 [Punica granatum]|uniref:Uncharacterized protein LOC116200058 n=1 Tax=Punica granatum TaxID=22663 RepID=A0A6P8CS36_PUNGR|nr:uncharacterized protein LOC116200058 [Punica granatum]
MAIAQNSLSSTRVPYLLLVEVHGKRKSFSGSSIRCAKKRDIADTRQSKKAILPSLRVSSPAIARSALAVFGLGFIDAGYSGDWSRIGVISKEGEDLLKVAAFVVIPLCLSAILSISKEQEP